MIRIVDKASGARSYDVEFYPGVIERLQKMRQDKTLVDGCWAPEYNILHHEGRGIPSPYDD